LASRGGLAIDVGANIGAHTLPLARAIGAAGHVIAIEPTAASFARLLRNCGLNTELTARITPIQAAVGAPGGQLQSAYYSRWPLEPGQCDHPVLLGAAQSTANAKFFTLDELVGRITTRPVTLIKIDVDGDELDVLSGAVAIIERDRPVVVFEVCPYLLVEHGKSAHDLVRFFIVRGYRLVDERTLDPLGTDASRIVAAIPEGGSRNLLALPAVDRPDGFGQAATE
jgi:FkbM family methyltransferase